LRRRGFAVVEEEAHRKYLNREVSTEAVLGQ
jgi:hypothetical protein